jgi:CRISPR-associated endoribonuclease Cas6
MLIQSTWTLTTNENTVLPRCYYLELVKKLHTKINLEIGKEKIPSTTCSGLIAKASLAGDFISFSSNELYQLSLSGLTETTAKAIASLELSHSLEFLGAKFNIIDRQDLVSSYEKIYTNLIAEEPEPIRQFNLSFVTPTAFATQQTHLPLPIPALMFRSWLEKWNHFASIYLGGDELIDYLSKAVKIKSHKLQTRNFQIDRGGYIVGFTGNLVLRVPKRIDPLLANVAHLLIEYASFANTGIKTRLGMGQTQIY